MGKDLSMRDIAERAGVSIATVSRYINRSGYVSQSMAEKIEAVIQDTHYTPNELARSVFRKHTKTIGVIVPNISNPLFNQLVLQIEKYANDYGYSIFLCNTQDKAEIEEKHLAALQGLRVAGIVAVRSHAKNAYKNLRIPIVAVENHIDEQIGTVSADNYLGGQLAFEHLYECGCRILLHIRGPETFEATEARYRGFCDAAKERGLSVDVITFDTDFHVELLKNKLHQFDISAQYDGIFVFNDITAATLLHFLTIEGIHVPDDVQIVGFDNSFIGQIVYPPLTTISQPIEKMSQTIIAQLFKLIENKKNNQHLPSAKNTFLTPHLVRRQTTTALQDKE